MKNLPVLYSRTSNGAVQVWQIETKGNSFYTIEGLQNGKMTTSVPTVCEGKNIGRANETTPEEQAELEAKAKWKKKIESGYFESLSDIDNETFTEPMLAKKFEDEFNDSMFPVYCQGKFDGQRCVAKKSGLFSRNGKPIVSVPHIHQALQKLFDADPSAILDGELYCDKLSDNFNKIISLTKKTKPTVDDLKESAAVIQYHVYDYISHGREPFSKRSDALAADIKKYCDPKVIVTVKTYKVNNRKELDEKYGEFLDAGYEGQMIRLNAPYEHKRSKYLLKRKEFQDTEYKILDVVEGDGGRTGMVGYCIMELAPGRTFKSNVKGDHGYLKEFLKNKKDIIGKKATVKYFCLTPDGVPRFPFILSVRDYE